MQTVHVASINPQGEPAYGHRGEWGWCRRGLLDFRGGPQRVTGRQRDRFRSSLATCH